MAKSASSPLFKLVDCHNTYEGSEHQNRFKYVLVVYEDELSINSEHVKHALADPRTLAGIELLQEDMTKAVQHVQEVNDKSKAEGKGPEDLCTPPKPYCPTRKWSRETRSRVQEPGLHRF